MQTARLPMWWDKLLAQADLVEGGAIFQLPINSDPAVWLHPVRCSLPDLDPTLRSLGEWWVTALT